MSSKPARVILLALMFALIASFAATPGAWDHFRFLVGGYDMMGETQSISDTLRLFSATVAGMYASGGNLAGLNMFPAEKLVKRRILLEFALNGEAGLLLVMDRDRSDVRQVLFSDLTHATAVADESWFMQYQNAETRRPVSGKKANIVTVRYFLKKMWNRWIVIDYEVYGREDVLPPVQHARFVTW